MTSTAAATSISPARVRVDRPRPPWPSSDSATVSVVVPTLNEAENIPYVFEKMPEIVAEIIVVDGFSTDDTVEVARRLRPDVRVVCQSRLGKGNALCHGFAEARGDMIVALDADGSADPTEIEHFVSALLAGADFVKGSRFLPGGGSADITPFRRLGNRALGGIVNLLFGTNCSDLCYGYSAFWRRCLPALRVDCNGFEVETLLYIQALRHRLKVAEIPSFERRRLNGRSNLHACRDGWRILRLILRERFARAHAAAAPGAFVEMSPTTDEAVGG